MPMKFCELTGESKLSRGRVSDCMLAVAAKENGVKIIYTENIDDFKV